jgi:hypothetical protein
VAPAWSGVLTDDSAAQAGSGVSLVYFAVQAASVVLQAGSREPVAPVEYLAHPA